MENINWYPGHMKKTRELIQENLKLVDVVCEILDARIPISSRNPIIEQLTANKIRIIVLNKTDLAEEKASEEWARALQKDGSKVLLMNCSSGSGSRALTALLEKIRNERNEGRERKRDLRLMIAGIPNVGKSSLINRLAGRKAARAGNKPGVTRGKQWVALGEHMMMLDTPGILWPKFEDPSVGLNLAFCGSIRDEIMDMDTLGLRLIEKLGRDYPELLKERYKLAGISESGLENMENIAVKRGFILPRKQVDYRRTAMTVLDEFRNGLIGRISLEKARNSPL